MSEIKDPAIKLFGKTIPLWPTDKLYTPLLHNQQHPPPDRNIPLIIDPPLSSLSDKPCTSEEDEDEEEEDDEEEDDNDGKKPTEDEEQETTTSSDQEAARYDDPKTPSLDKEPTSPKVSNKDQSDTQDTTLTKPDKILPCPRCNSMDTKFCYFNNYNVNQPRHFCKNCQRYWTAGGTMRNVPVGSGRRKNKSSPSSSSSSSSSSHYRHALAMEALQATGGTNYPVLRPNIIAFGSDAPLCETMNSTLNLGENNSVNHIGDDSQQETVVVKNFPTLPIPYYAGPPWPMPWRAPAATFGPPGFPTLIYPAPPPPFWGCIPIIPTNTIPTEAAISYGPSSPLGKHSREGNIFGSKEVGGGDVGGRGVLVHPKTLRIDDPNEAAKSSIWSTLGIKNENLDSVIGRGLFKPLNSKSEVEQRTSLAMQANPVALSRSQNFRENAP